MNAETILNLSVVIPAYNEARRLPQTLARIEAYLQARGYAAEIIVVDDGSTDSTAALVECGVASGAPVRLLRNERNRGKGYSVRCGVLASRGSRVLFSDADLSAPIEEADRLLAALAEGWDIAIGSRALNPELLEVPQGWLRRLVGRAFRFLVRLVLQMPFADTQCGFKAFRLEVIERIFRLQRIEGFGFDPEILFLARQQGLRVVEVGVRGRDDPESRVRLLCDGLRMMLALFRIRWYAVTGKYAEAGARPGAHDETNEGRAGQ